MAELFANGGDPDQTLCSAASDLGLHCLQSTLLQVSRLQWINDMVFILSSPREMGKKSQYRSQEREQEAHGPRFAHLSDIATADMQMLCNIFPILSSQLMKISSFEQFLVLKKNIWA